MKVLKFGGTSVGTVERLNNVKKIIDSIQGMAVIVVSALGGLTDKLISTAKLASYGDIAWKNEMAEIRLRHLHIIDNVITENKIPIVIEKVDTLLKSLEKDYESIYSNKSLPEYVLDIVVSYGERISSEIVSAMVRGGKRYYSPDFIKTEKWYDKNIANRSLTEELIKSTFKSLQPNEKAIVPGFISTDSRSGKLTNLGRGGSDYTGALIAAALDAELLEIWTDVDGFMTADPRIVKDALVVNHLTFEECMELCTFGAKVIYPPTIYPVFHKNIPIKILNTFNPEAKGSLITERHYSEDHEVKGVSILKDITLISIDVNKESSLQDISKRVLNVLSKKAIRIIPIKNQYSYNYIKIAILSADAESSKALLEEELGLEIKEKVIERLLFKDNLSALAVVGKNMRDKVRFADRIKHSLYREGVDPEGYSIGNSDTNLIFIINQEKSSKALNLVHSLIW